ncbi:S1 family peptidase [Paeniglutamicibacter sp. R2-26]|uniref:S1 family peptidase n=1 Tax=Paeniglutamicibacter sp. R2-26 TaxID=3144417 RepID=UPI003EE6306C
MPELRSTRLRRAGIAAVAAALVVSSCLAAGPVPATAATIPSPGAVATPGPRPTESRAETTDSGDATPSNGLDAAVERDLGMSAGEFAAQGELAAVADRLRAELDPERLKASLAVAGSRIEVRTNDEDRAEVAEKIDTLTRGTDIQVEVTTAVPTPTATAGAVAPTKKSPTNVDELYAAYAASVDEQTLGQLQAVMETDGGFVIRSGGVSGDAPARSADRVLRAGGTLTPEEFASQYPDVGVHEAEGPATATASNDVLGGMGYGAEVTPGVYALCSVGFNGFNAAGARAALSAGHCTRDGQIRSVSVAEHSAPDVFEELHVDSFGTFGFSQFGGPGNSPALTDGVNLLGNVGTDVSVLNKINPALRQQPVVTDWTGADERDSGTKVTGVSSAVRGSPVCKSGRTTGWTCGKVTEVGIFIVGGFGNAATDLRAVRGFGMANPGFAVAFEGDSGGSAISGGNAVGITSAIAEGATRAGDRAYFADVKQALRAAKGYSIKLFVNAPKLTQPAKGTRVKAGARVSGTVASAPAGTTVSVASAGKTIATAKVSKGTFSFRTPKKLGTFSFTMTAGSGYSKSRTTTASLPLTMPAPRITVPAAGTTKTGRVTRVSGTGFPGATVKFSGAAKGRAAVAKDGTWSVKVPAIPYGNHVLTATQAKGKHVSGRSRISFKVAVRAPAISSPSPGKTSTKAPRTIKGTGIPGATLKLSGAVGKTLVVPRNGTWSVKLKRTWDYGNHRIKATQKVGKHTSASAKTSFKVIPRSPSIDYPSAGRTFASGKAPATVSGRGISGATVKVTMGKRTVSTKVVRGTWKVRIPGTLKPGSHGVKAVQVMKKTSSNAVRVTFTVKPRAS